MAWENQDKNWVLKAGGRHLQWGQRMGTLREKAALRVPGERDDHWVGRQQRFHVGAESARQERADICFSRELKLKIGRADCGQTLRGSLSFLAK